MADTPSKPEKKLKTSLFVMLVSEYPLYDATLGIRFQPQVKTEVPEISQWLQMQIDAKLVEVIE